MFKVQNTSYINKVYKILSNELNVHALKQEKNKNLSVNQALVSGLIPLNQHLFSTMSKYRHECKVLVIFLHQKWLQVGPMSVNFRGRVSVHLG